MGSITVRSFYRICADSKGFFIFVLVLVHLPIHIYLMFTLIRYVFLGNSAIFFHKSKLARYANTTSFFVL